MQRGSTPRSLPTPRTRNICRHIFSRASAIGGVDRFNKVAQRVAKAAAISRPAARHGLPGLCLFAARPGREGQGCARRNDRGTGFTETFLVGPYALAVSPARYAVERGDWKAAAELQVRPSPLSQIQAITYFARALGAARSGNPEAAKPDIARLGELRDKLREAKDAYWSEQVDIQQKVASAWVLYAEGKYDDALKAMRRLPTPRTRPKTSGYPGVPKPARELYGVMLLERGWPAWPLPLLKPR